MNPLELRKVVQIGAAVSAAGVRLTILFWVPQRPGRYVRSEASSRDIAAFPWELQALADGAIVEQVEEFDYATMPAPAELRKQMLEVWERKMWALHGAAPNGAPVDMKPKVRLQFDLRGD